MVSALSSSVRTHGSGDQEMKNGPIHYDTHSQRFAYCSCNLGGVPKGWLLPQGRGRRDCQLASEISACYWINREGGWFSLSRGSWVATTQWRQRGHRWSPGIILGASYYFQIKINRRIERTKKGIATKDSEPPGIDFSHPSGSRTPTKWNAG